MLNAFFSPVLEKEWRRLSWAWNGGLYLTGVAAWGWFLNWGNIPFDFHDWAEVWAPRIAVVRDALLKGTIPLHMSNTTALRGVTDRFFTIPDVISTPQMFLLRFMEPGPYILVNTLLLYTIATWGLLLLRKRFSLSLGAYTALFILFHFNGNILAHFSVGHVNWGGYYLFPFFILFLLQLIDGDHSWRWITKTAFIVFLILLQGSFHMFVWCILCMILLAITSWKTFPTLFKTLVATMLLSLFRLLPPTLGLGLFDDEFIGGYPTLLDLWRAMIEIVSPAGSLGVRSEINLLGWWELDIYIGVAGAIFLILFGTCLWLRRASNGEGYPELVIPVFTLVILSIGRIYRLVILLSIPLINAERVSSRIFLLPFAFLLVMAAWELQRWLDRPGQDSIPRLAVLGCLAIMVHDLWQHFKLWQVSKAFQAFPYTLRDLSIVAVNNHPDPPYTVLLWVGAVSFLLASAFLLYKSSRERKNVSR